jgi:membrane-bound lytic murein transglycosylase A
MQFIKISALALLSFLTLTGCHHTPPLAAEALKLDFKQPLPGDMVALRKISPAEYPDFARDPIVPLRLGFAIDRSLEYMATPSSQAFYPYLDITHDRAVATLHRLRAICREQQTRGTWDAAWFNQQIRDQFDVYKSIGAPKADGSGYSDRVLFTGYFTPVYSASLTRTDVYRWPLYKLPADLKRDPKTGDVFGRQTEAGQVVPYYTRHEIETGGKLAGSELVWLKSRWEAYIITVQGSARLKLIDSGTIFEVGFAGTNGYEYTSPGQQMLADGVITKDQLSLKGLGDYLVQNPAAMDKYLSLNQRYIFFTERPGGPFGSLNVPVTRWGSIATDKSKRDIYPRAMPAFIDTFVTDDTGQNQPFANFLLDQDTGGAIRASGRTDIYMGIGSEAEGMAGRELQEGALYYIAVKPGLSPEPVDSGVPLGSDR